PTTRDTLQPPQTHLAYSLGSAIPIFVNPGNLEIGFMLNLPIIERANVYRLKTVLNVGFWKENTHVQLKTPLLLAYHDADPKLYLIPNLDLCTKTKDLHWVCPSNPFIRDVTDYMCGLREGSPEQNCQAKVTLKDVGLETKVERAGNRWLVSTPVTEALLSYDQHDTVTRIKLPNQTMFVSVPQGALLHLGDIILHHLNLDRYDTEIEIMDAFKGYNFSIDASIENQLIVEGTKQIKFSLTPAELSFTPLPQFPRRTEWTETHTMTVTVVLLVIGWVVTAGMAHTAYRQVKRLQVRIDSLTFIPSRFIAPPLPMTQPGSSP
ncbi:hypothetical protein XENOCAPTIV_028468, partial [Xenoophorus captivus]